MVFDITFCKGDLENSYTGTYGSRNSRDSRGPTPESFNGDYLHMLRSLLGALECNTLGIKEGEPIRATFDPNFPEVEKDITKRVIDLHNHHRRVPQKVLDQLAA